MIQGLAGKKIKDGDVILTYARWDDLFFSASFIIENDFRSSVVEKILLNAKKDGKEFSVIVIDSQPLLEGLS